MGATRLYFTASVEEQWQTVVNPWLREQAAAWKNPKPTVVLTPSRAEGFYLRSRLVEEGASLLGIRFWTPSDARKFLIGKLSPIIGPATEAELRLVARVCAERLLGRAGTPAASALAGLGTLTSIAQEPGPFLRAGELLQGAGWDPGQSGAAYGRALAEEMERELGKNRIATQAGIHRQLLGLAPTCGEPLIAKLLMVGFNAEHWPLWDLLKAALFSAEDAGIVLSSPAVFAGGIDQLWISSWEEVAKIEAISPMGPISPMSADEIAAPFAGLIASYEQGATGGAENSDLAFLVTPDLASQARAVALQAVEYLRHESCARLGIVFPGANALALEVAGHLRRLGIPLDDGTGTVRPGVFERRGWPAWLALQEEASVQRLIAWWRACEVEGLSCGLSGASPSARQAAEALDGALGESLVDDLDFLARYLEESGDRRAGAVAELMRQRIVLPGKATFAEFLATTREALAGPGWEEHLARLQIDPPAWLWGNREILSRRVFLGWLKEETDSREWTSGAEGNHFYGKVHLLIYAQMTGQTWSHLILTGLNEGIWPRVFEAEAFGSRHELEELNVQARKLNRRGTTQGGQGEGHEVVQEGHGYCLVPLERRDLALRDLCAALEGTSVAACLTAMTTEAGRSLLPSDFFSYAYHAKTGRALDEETFRFAANETLAWCRRHESLFAFTTPKESIAQDIAATRIAYEARRDATRFFGSYEFAFREPPPRPIQLSCKRWEDAWSHPATVWLEEVVGVSLWPEGMLSWPRAIGTWVHRWLTTALRECAGRNSARDFLALLRQAADREPVLARDRARAIGLELYPWWDQVCGQAKSIALALGESLEPLLQNGQFLSEFRLPENISIALPGSGAADFALTGRIDLLLIEPGSTLCDPKNGDFSGCACWVIDFKTGSAQNLTGKKIEKGMGLQPLLYALAVQARGAESTSISLHTRDAALERQVELADALEIGSLFRSLDKFHRAGVFGMRADAANEYGYAPAYPMATRFVSPSVLAEKWALTHGTDAEEEAE